MFVLFGTVKLDRCPSCNHVLMQRSSDQNSKLHALLQDIATQKQWAGHWLDVEDWKRLMVAAFERHNKQAARIFPSIDGQGIDMIYRRTSRMTKEEMSELIEFATAWALDNDILLRDQAPLEAA